ncbi:hypothetical protein KY331_00785 [Candidatus Woesearchaeota archaeon]|nr:hypothetical protein [Candidatus Woesearchaeota archaeon]
MKLNKDWTYYLTRPFTLLGASIWYRWYNSDKTKEILGENLPDALFIEELPNIMRRYSIKSQLKRFNNHLKNIVIKNPKKCKQILEEGIEINKNMNSTLKKKFTLEKAVDFFIEMQLKTTLFPFFAYKILYEEKIKDKELFALTAKLRSVSFYPQFLNNIILPLAQKNLGVTDDINLMTVSEVLDGNKSVIKDRKKQKLRKQYLVYQILDGKETVEFIDDSMKIITKIENIKLTDVIKGTSAYPGKVKGRVRLVLYSTPNIPFDKGDILVSPSTNPNLVPLFNKSAAVVTDEGGIMSHAAIVSREMGIPCVIGTKIATKVLKDGDYVEVDADKGIVRKIK